MGQESSQIEGAGENGNANGVTIQENVDQEEMFDVEGAGSGGEDSVRSGSAKSSKKVAKPPRKKEKKSKKKKKKSLETVEKLEETPEDPGVELAPATQDDIESSFTYKKMADDSNESGSAKKNRDKLKKQQISESAIAEPDIKEEDVSVQVPASAPKESNDVDLQMEGELPEVVAKSPKRSRKSRKSTGDGAVAETQYFYEQQAENATQDADAAQVLQQPNSTSETPSGTKKSKKPKEVTASKITKSLQSPNPVEEDYRREGNSNPIVPEIEEAIRPEQLPTPEASRKPRRESAENPIVAEAHLDSRIRPPVEEPGITLVKDSQSQPSAKQKRKSRKSGDSESVPKKKAKRSKINAYTALTDEELIDAVADTDVQADLPGNFDSSLSGVKHGSPITPHPSHNHIHGFHEMDAEDIPVFTSPVAKHHPSSSSFSVEIQAKEPPQYITPAKEPKVRSTPKTQRDLPKKHDTSVAHTSPPKNPIVPQKRTSHDHTSLEPSQPLTSWNAVNKYQYDEPTAVPTIGIYKLGPNGVMQRSHSSQASREEDEDLTNDPIENMPTPNAERSASGKKKRRAPTGDESTFDPPTADQIPRSRKKPKLIPKIPGSRTPKTPRTMSSSNAIPTLTSAAKSSTKKKAPSREPTTQGAFSKNEINVIENELVKWREAHNDMSEADLNQLIQDNATTGAELWNQLSEALPDRTRQSIIKICRRRYHNYGARGKWTEEEDEELRYAYSKYPKGWKQISQMLNRHPEDVRDRWRNYLICGDNLKKEVWSEEEEHALRVAIVECLEAVKEIRAQEGMYRKKADHDAPKTDEELIDWQMVSQKLGHTRSRLQCMTKWKHMKERENSDGGEAQDLEIGHKSWRVTAARKTYQQMGQNDKLALLNWIRHSQAGREGKVPFNRLGDEEFRQKWPCMVRKVAWKNMRAMVPGNEDMKLQDIVTTLIDLITADPGYADKIPDLYGEQATRKRNNKPRVSKQNKPALSEAIISPEDDEDEEQQNSPNESRKARKEKKKLSHRMALESQSSDHAKGSPELGADEFDPDVIHARQESVANEKEPRRLSQEDINRTIEAVFAEENDDDIDMSDSLDGDKRRIPESPRLSKSTISRGRAVRRSQPFSHSLILNHDSPKNGFENNIKSDEDSDGDIPARRRSNGSVEL